MSDLLEYICIFSKLCSFKFVDVTPARKKINLLTYNYGCVCYLIPVCLSYNHKTTFLALWHHTLEIYRTLMSPQKSESLCSSVFFCRHNT